MTQSPLSPTELPGEPAPLISRFTIALLSFLLLGMAIGYTLSSATQALVAAAGGVGLLFYSYRMWQTRSHQESARTALRQRVEERLISAKK